MHQSRVTSRATAVAIITLTFSFLIVCTFLLLPRSAQALPADLAEVRLPDAVAVAAQAGPAGEEASAHVARAQQARRNPGLRLEPDGVRLQAGDVHALASTRYVSPTCTLPGFYCTIQAAANASSSGDTINISGHTYTEARITSTHSLTFQGAGAGTTIVQAAATRAAATNCVFRIRGGVDVTFISMTIRHGKVTGANDGGGIYVEGNLTLVDTEVVSNTAEYGFGGGAYVDLHATLDGALFQDNASVLGGGLYVPFGALTMTDTQFIHNTSGWDGAGANVFSGATLNGGRFQDNEAGRSGGGLTCWGAVVMSGTEFFSNTADIHGGGAYVRYTATLNSGLFEGNFADSEGGGLYVYDGDLSMTGTQFIGNAADDNGGGAWVWYDAILNGGLFQDNYADDYGGGLYVYDGDLSMTGTHFIGNAADDNGGGAWVSNTVTLDLGIFQDNYARGGGGLYVDEGSLSMTGTQFISNTAYQYDGGGAFVQKDATLNGGRFQDNEAGCSGGGLDCWGAVVMSGTEFFSNTADLWGGGAYVLKDATLNGGLFRDNRAYEGGGLSVRHLHMTDTQFIGNAADDWGGGAQAQNVTANGALFQENHAGSDGGGLYNQGRLTVSASRFVGNTAAHFGGGLAHGGQGSIVNSLFARNAATPNGQAIFINQIADTLDIVHCTVVSPTTSTGTAIYLVDSHVNISNTIVANFGTAIKNQTDSARVNEDYNLFWPTSMVSSTGTINQGGNSFYGDPAFIDPANDNYHLGAGSAAIDAAPDLGVAVDLDGNPRPESAAPDIGAYEAPGLRLIDHRPITHELGVALTAPISASFDGAVDGTSVNTGTFFVHGGLTGLYRDTYTLSGDQLTFTPGRAFHTGEVVRVHATSGISATDGRTLQPYGWTFTAGPILDRCFWGLREISTTATITGVNYSAVAWGDVDNDGDLDLAVTGQQYGGIGFVGALYRNDGTNATGLHLTEVSVLPAGLTGVADGTLDWGDYDNDGDLDLLLTGRVSPTLAVSKLYRNDGGGSSPILTDMSATIPMTGVHQSAADWGDYDNDGDLDILVSGNHSTTGQVPSAWVYRNDGPLGFTDIDAFLLGVRDGSAEWGDADGDGDLDILLTGYDPSWCPESSRIYVNDGTGSFAIIDAGLPGSAYGASTWVDVDNDSDLDILITGYAVTACTGTAVPTTKLYLNDGTANFTEALGTGLTDTYDSSLAWGDVDNDGDLDLALTGVYSEAHGTRLYLNQGGALFEEMPGTLSDVADGSVAWGDVDNDGDLDLLLTGSGLGPGAAVVTADLIGPVFPGPVFGVEPVTQLYRNDDGFHITDHRPTQHQVGVSVTAPISAAFDGDVDTSSVTSRTFFVHGHLTGLFTDTYAYDAGSRTLTVDPARPYHTGEKVRVHATGDISGTTDNGRSAQLLPYGWEFTAGPVLDRCAGGFNALSAGDVLSDVSDAAVAWADYNNDGYLDILLTGWVDIAVSATKLYRNLGTATPSFVEETVLPAALPGAPGGAAAWGDYDNDGDLDLLLTPFTEGGFADNSTSEARALGEAVLPVDGFGYSESKLFRNDGAGAGGWIFTEETIFPFSLPGASSSSVEWGDFDNDGDLDIVLAGAWYGRVWFQAPEPGDVAAPSVVAIVWHATMVFRNDGASATGWTFTDVAVLPQALPIADDGSAAWGDYDNDGDLDILLTGAVSPTLRASRVYRNDGPAGSGWRFVEENVLPAGLVGVSDGQGAWGDYDNDGDLDLVLTGEVSSCVSAVYRNDGGAAGGWLFNDIHAPLSGTVHGSAAWGDYDNDGDLDLLLTGSTGCAGAVYTVNPETRIYRNDGSDTFVDTGAALAGAYHGAAAWGDAENDGDLDILIAGDVAEYAPNAALYANVDCLRLTDHRALQHQVGVSLTAPISATFDHDLDASTVNSSTLFVHGHLTGLYTDTYAVTGDTLTFTPGRAYHTGETIRVHATSGIRGIGLGALVPYGWEFVSGPVLDRCFGGFADIGASLMDLYFGDAAWGDYDNDGDLDLVLTGLDDTDSPVSRLYRNDGLAGFTNSGVTLVDVYYGSADWGDYDKDGDLDLLLTGRDGTSTQHSIVYRNEGGGTFTNIGAAITPVGDSSADWGDYDNDGDLDILLAGDSGSGVVTKVYRNDGGTPASWTFHDIAAGLPGVVACSVAWGDVDNDGDLDILVSGDDNSPDYLAKVFRNDGGDAFSDIHAGLTGVYRSSGAWGDYDGDGDLDLLLTGAISTVTPHTTLYENDGAGGFADSGAALTQIKLGSASWGDVDNDGDLDILLVGDTDLGEHPTIYRNDGAAFTGVYLGLTNLRSSAAAWGDYDNDGDLDIVLMGEGPPVASKIYRNDDCADLSIVKAVEPSAAYPGDPFTFTLTYSNAGQWTATGVVISDIVASDFVVEDVAWSGARVTDTSAVPPYVWAVEELDPAAGGFISITGHLQDICAPGGQTLMLVNRALISGEGPQTHYDNNESMAGIRLLHTQPPTVTFTAAPTSCCVPLTVHFTDTSTAGHGAIVDWWWEFGDGATSHLSNTVHTYTAGGTYSVTLTVTDSHGCGHQLTQSEFITAHEVQADFLATAAAGCAPLTIDFTDLSTATPGDVVAWLWDFGDGGSSFQQHPSHTFAPVGTFTVILTAIDSHGCSDQAQMVIRTDGCVEVIKTDRRDPVPATWWVRYDIWVTNPSATAAQEVVLVDVIPEGMYYVKAAENEGWTHGPGVVSRTFSSILPGATVHAPLVLGTHSNLFGTVTNTVAAWWGDVASIATEDTFITRPPVGPPPACPDGYEPNDTTYEAWAVTPRTLWSYICCTSPADEDYFSFAVEAGQTIAISLTDVPDDYELCLYGPDRAQVACSTHPGTQDEHLQHEALSAGDYYAHVFGHEARDCHNTLPYRLEIVVGGGQPVVVDTPTPTPTATPTPTERPDATLLVTKLVDREYAEPGDELSYTIVVMNDMLGGEDPGAHVTLRDELPQTLALVPGSLSPEASYDEPTRTISWEGQVPRGGSLAITFRAVLTAAAADMRSVSNGVLVADAFGREYQVQAQTHILQPGETGTPLPTPTGTTVPIITLHQIFLPVMRRKVPDRAVGAIHESPLQYRGISMGMPKGPYV